MTSRIWGYPTASAQREAYTSADASRFAPAQSPDVRSLGALRLPRDDKRELLLAQFVVQAAGEKPAYPEHVGGSAEGAVAQAVFAQPEFSRSMIHRDFDEAKAGSLHQRGDESVHPLEGKERADAFAPHRL